MSRMQTGLTGRTIATTWWPLALSWLFMALELPVVSAGLARLPDPEVQLAAYGGVVMALLLLVESPIIMLLAASTALSRDGASYLSLRGFMHRLSAGLTLLQLVLATTPLYDFVVTRLIAVPEAVVEPARIGLLIALPWAWTIAYRRFNQGILIRHGASRAVGVGTLLRLTANVVVLGAGLGLYRVAPHLTPSGVALGTSAVLAGVVAEAAFVRWRVTPILQQNFDLDSPSGEGIALGELLRFYVPLALTSLLALIMQPIGSAAVSRMPLPLPSLAAWPIVIGVVFLLRSPGTAYKEVVVALLDRPDPEPALRRFTLWLVLISLGLSLLAFTPLANFLLVHLSGLTPELATLAGNGLKIAVLLPAVGVLQNRYVGVLVHRRRTRPITESMVAFLSISIAGLIVGVRWGEVPGVYVAYAAFTAGHLAQLYWVRRAAHRTAAAP
ncbi:MAG TPA: hypothetical protein QGG47_14535 [Acidobacteriota bacterium]|nr:hypothetical protein [Acidobacteriota bacterium]